MKTTFEILYARPGDEEACARTLALFSDCKIRDGKKSDTFDHACETRRHLTTKEALDRVRETLEKVGDDVISIQISVVF